MIKTVLSLILVSNIASAAYLEDVKLLNATPSQEGFQLKLKTKDSPRDSFFIVDVVKADPESFEKLVHVIQKMKLKDAYRLDLDIMSFSPSPSGSYYRSEGIRFSSPSAQAAASSDKPASKGDKTSKKRSAASEKDKPTK